MTDTVLFDLDGTLLQFAQDDFITAYFGRIKAVFANLGMDAELAAKAVWAGTKAMAQNDGTKLNSERFWRKFTEVTGLPDERLGLVEAACDRFYRNEFDDVKSILKSSSDLPRRLVRKLASRGFGVVLATNPLFPACAVEARLGWLGLMPQDFLHITDYSNSTFCKPNLGYYREIFDKIGKDPQSCIMVGNNPVEDMAAAETGAQVFLCTDNLENETGVDISAFPHGTLSELTAYLEALPDAGRVL